MKRSIQARGAIRILIVGVSVIFRLGLRTLLAKQRGLRVVGEAADYATAERLARKLKPDILMLDLDIPRHSASFTLQKYGELGRRTRVIVLSSVVDKSLVVEALRLGARGVVVKDGVINQEKQAIRAVFAGQCWLDGESFSDVLEYVHNLSPARSSAKQINFGLTSRETEILHAIAAGLGNKDIAQEFKISQETVKHHLTHIYDKLGVSNRLELALFIINHSLTAPN
jgi:two-component system nitrate/nitrite response regulator NarL